MKSTATDMERAQSKRNLVPKDKLEDLHLPLRFNDRSCSQVAQVPSVIRSRGGGGKADFVRALGSGQRKKAAELRRELTRNPPTSSPNWTGFGILKVTDQRIFKAREWEGCWNSAVMLSPPKPEDDWGIDNVATRAASGGGGGDRGGTISQRTRLIPPLLSYASRDGGRVSSCRMAVFPLPVDHRLITLVQYNVVRALLVNASILSLLSSVPGAEACKLALGMPSHGAEPDEIPPDLRPTPTQQASQRLHPFWIDVLPFPTLRDNLILMSGMYSSEELCYDMGQALYEGFDDVERRGFLVWGDAWSSREWEVSEGFVSKWGFLLRGCEDVIESANRWRELRGEEALAIEV